MEKEFLIKKEIAEKVLRDVTHHAFCFITDNPKKVGEVLREVVQTVWGVPFDGNSDFLHYSKNSFEIGDAHFLRDWISVNPANGFQKIFILESYNITIESQNALLKIFESTTEKVRFIVVVPSKEVLLSTLYSRFFVSSLDSFSESDVSIDEFLSSDIAKRSEVLKDMITERDRSGTQMFLDLLERRIYQYELEEDKLNINQPEFSNFIRSLPMIKKINLDQRSSVKAVLEHVIHFAPFIKRN